MSKPTIHVIEPTLQDEAGHCHSFVRSICEAGEPYAPRRVVWTGRRVEPDILQTSGAEVIPFFYRRIRRPQSFFLYRRLLREPGRIFVATASRTDVILLQLAADERIPKNKVFLYFHWLTHTRERRDFFRKMAGKQPDLVILGPTQSVVQFFLDCGFLNANLVPYPITPKNRDERPGPFHFRHLLFAGAARQDKGFHHIVKFLAYLAERQNYIPALIQTSSEHYNKYDSGTKELLRRLKEIYYPSLELCPDTMETPQFLNLFPGAICLQPYHKEDFSDRISGITLDALSEGCPIIATSGTWMARVAGRFDAGAVIDDAAPEHMLFAVQSIMSDYSRYSENALKAGLILEQEHNAANLLSIIAS